MPTAPTPNALPRPVHLPGLAIAGHHAWRIAPAALVITDLDTGAVLSLAAVRPDAVLGIGGEAWVVSAGGQVLSRYRGNGVPIGEPVALPAAPASAVVPCRTGGAAVAVAGNATVVADDRGVRAQGQSNEPVVPVAGGVVARSGECLVVRGEGERTLEVPGELLRGAVLCGGAALDDAGARRPRGAPRRRSRARPAMPS